MTESRKKVDRRNNPFPDTWRYRIVGVCYGDRLEIVRHAKRMKGAPGDGEWQLADDYELEVDIDYENEAGRICKETWVLVAPRGMYTDLSSVPAAGRWIVSKSGPHLEASIIHDYLYMTWPDVPPGKPLLRQWIFADTLLSSALRTLPDLTRFQKLTVILAVSSVGWIVFSRKKRPLSQKLKVWRPHLDGAESEASAHERKPPLMTQGTLALGKLALIAMGVLGVDQLTDAFSRAEWVAPTVRWYLTAVACLVWGLLVVGITISGIFRVYAWLQRRIGKQLG